MSAPWEETWIRSRGVVRCGDEARFAHGSHGTGKTEAATLDLAAAAPDLFRALDGLMRAVLDDEAPGHAVSHALIAAHAAIRKARGES